jgi:hypothetical protein
MTEADFEILVHMMNGAKPPDFAVRLLEDICARTNLSWKARHVYLQKRRNKSGADSWQAVLSIDGFRAVGARHPDYAGQEGPLFVTGAEAVWTDIPPEAKPYAAKVGIKKKDGLTTWGVAKYSDYYAGMMWDKFPSTMIAKCAEMLAWRKTFPETFGGLYGDAEMAQSQTKAEPEVMGEVETRPPGLQAAYMERLNAAARLEDLKAVGADIQKDKNLTSDETIVLHTAYTKLKTKLEKGK